MTHTLFMQQALMLAEQGRYSCKPNPMVGCVIVVDGEVVGRGYHKVAGQGHAEVNALADAGDKARGATAYVTLEPCAHTGRTGPCCVALAEAGITHVVYGCVDPNPLVAGAGLNYLRTQGVQVTGPILEAECLALNRAFFYKQRTGLPWVYTKIGASLDGRTAMANGESKWITGEQSRERVQQLRAEADVLITGMKTVRVDQPRLNIRPSELNGLVGREVKVPERWVISRTWPSQAELSLDPADGKVVVVTPQTLDSAPEGLENIAELVSLPSDSEDVDLTALIALLGERAHNAVMIEAGANLNAAFIQQNLVNELVMFMAPKLLGAGARPLLNIQKEHLSDAIELELTDVSVIDNDICVRADIVVPQQKE